MGAAQGKRTVFSTHLCIGGQQWSTQSQPRHFQSGAQRRPCTHPPPPKGHCRKWHHKMKVSWIYLATSGKGLTVLGMLKITKLDFTYYSASVYHLMNCKLIELNHFENKVNLPHKPNFTTSYFFFCDIPGRVWGLVVLSFTWGRLIKAT